MHLALYRLLRGDVCFGCYGSTEVKTLLHTVHMVLPQGSPKWSAEAGVPFQAASSICGH